MNPLQRSYVVKAVGLTKDHADQEKEDCCLIKSLICSQLVICTLVELFHADNVVERSVNDPILRHVPFVSYRHEVQCIDSES